MGLCLHSAGLHVQVIGTVSLPVPRWLVPTSLVRWFVPKLVGLALPFLARLNERYERSALQARVLADADGFYAALRRRLPAMRQHVEHKCQGHVTGDGQELPWTAMDASNVECTSNTRSAASPIVSPIERLLYSLQGCAACLPDSGGPTPVEAGRTQGSGCFRSTFR